MSSQFEDPSFDKLSATPQDAGAVGHGQSNSSSPIEGALHKYETELMAVPGVVGVGIGQDSVGNQVIKVYVKDKSVKARVPKEVGGYPSQVEVTGEFHAQ